MDEDFPPINAAQDITTLGIQNFWVDLELQEQQDQQRSLETRIQRADTAKESLLSSHDTEVSERRIMSMLCCCCRTSRNLHQDARYEALPGYNPPNIFAGVQPEPEESIFDDGRGNNVLYCEV